MLRLSKKIEYGLMAMLEVAQQGEDEPVTAKSISMRYRIPKELMGKVLQTLVKNKLLTSVQGVKGGYTMAKSLDRITLLDMVEAIDGPVSLIACSTGTICTCEQIPACNIKTPMGLVQEELVQFFTGITLQDLQKKYKDIIGISQINNVAS